MNKQPEALRLADWLVIRSNGPMDARHKVAAELRRLHEENEAFGKRQEWWNDRMFELETALRQAVKEIAELRAAIKTRSQKLAKAGYKRRPSAKSLPSDE